MEIIRRIFKRKPKKIKEVLPKVEDKILAEDETFENEIQRELSQLRKSMKEAKK